MCSVVLRGELRGFVSTIREVRSLLSAIGLSLDVVGAVALVVGLFRPTRPLVTGYAYAPDDAARDSAFGVAGTTLLVAGFVLQSLSYFGVSVKCSTATTVGSSIGALAVAIAYTLVAFEVTHRLVFDRRREEGLRNWNMDYPLNRRRGLWFWRPDDNE
jgi:hypothetical protein